jgi:ubiquinone/menaquinone biosynthesis C-methylase UbiE
VILLNYSTVIDPLLRDIRIHTPIFSGMKKKDKVLDVCCGTGDQVIYYGRREITAWGIDNSPKMIEMAEKKKAKSGLENVFFLLGDAKKLPFENNFFDFVSISFGLHEIKRDERDRIISEMKRVVKEKGILIFIDFQAPLPNSFYSLFIQAIEFFAGKNHFQFFKDYLEQGGLPVLLKKHNLKEIKKDYFKEGVITIIKTKII